MNPRLAMRFLLFVLVGVVVVLLGDEVIARVGGGHSYSGGGGGGSYSGGGDGGDGSGLGELIYWLIRLIIEWPEVGIPVTIVVVVIALVSRARGGWSSVQTSVGSAHVSVDSSRQRASKHQLERNLSTLRRSDPGFSTYVFLDFCALLYARFNTFRGHPTPGVLRPFVDPEILSRAAAEDVQVSRVIVAAMDVHAIRFRGSEVALTVTVTSNMDERAASGRPVRWYYQERLTFRRRRDVRSPAPASQAALTCPSCGAAAETDLQARCAYCGQVVNTGDHGWVVSRIQVLERRVPSSVETHLFPGGDEPGVGLRTRMMPNLGGAKRALQARDSHFTWEHFLGHVRFVFLVLQEAWSSLQWEEARPYETDNLFQTHRFWIEQYKAEGLQNHVKDVHIEDVVPCKVTQDPYYDIITVRITASMLDYTADIQGRVVGGNDSRRRRFSEYWTFLRRIGVTSTSDRPPGACPSCGAAMSGVDAAGICGSCQAKVVSGAFDWTLAKIDQDETYTG